MQNLYFSQLRHIMSFNPRLSLSILSTLFCKDSVNFPSFLTMSFAGIVIINSHRTTEVFTSPVFLKFGVPSSINNSVCFISSILCDVIATKITSLYRRSIEWSEIIKAGRAFCCIPVLVTKGKGKITISPRL